jgi:hypothetical protein
MSFVRNPDPAKVTGVPNGPEDGFRAIKGERTVKLFEEKSPPGFPVAMIV